MKLFKFLFLVSVSIFFQSEVFAKTEIDVANIQNLDLQTSVQKKEYCQVWKWVSTRLVSYVSMPGKCAAGELAEFANRRTYVLEDSVYFVRTSTLVVNLSDKTILSFGPYSVNAESENADDVTGAASIQKQLVQLIDELKQPPFLNQYNQCYRRSVFTDVLQDSFPVKLEETRHLLPIKSCKTAIFKAD